MGAMEYQEWRVAAEVGAKLIGGSGAVVVISGAGLSAGSGIPTIERLRDGGVAAEKWLHVEQYRRDPCSVWRWLDSKRGALANANPNRAHVALVEIARSHGCVLLATHNVDGLLQLAGANDVLELSGNLWQMRCEREGRIFTDHTVPLSKIPPRCACGAPLRPNVVLFGERLREGPFGKLRQTLEEDSGILVVVGLSGRGSTLIDLVERASAHWSVIEVNPRASAFSSFATVTIRNDAASTLAWINGRISA